MQKEPTKANSEKSGKEGAWQGKPSVLKILQEDSKVPRADKPLKLSVSTSKNTKNTIRQEL